MVISSRKSSGRGSNKQTNKPLLRRASPFLRLSIFTYDPASIARTVFHTPSSRIVKRISTPTRRKISLVDDKKKKKKRKQRKRNFEKSAEMIHTRDGVRFWPHTATKLSNQKVTRESSVVVHYRAFVFTLDRGRKDEGGWVAKNSRRCSFTPLPHLQPLPFTGQEFHQDERIYPIGIFGIYHETSPHAKGEVTRIRWGRVG